MGKINYTGSISWFGIHVELNKRMRVGGGGVGEIWVSLGCKRRMLRKMARDLRFPEPGLVKLAARNEYFWGPANITDGCCFSKVNNITNHKD